MRYNLPTVYPRVLQWQYHTTSSVITEEKTMLILFTDSDCDLSLEKCKEFGYHLISMPYQIDDQEPVYPYEDFDQFDSKTFYDTLRTGVVPKTFAISPDKYMSYFEPHFANGDDILYVHFSRAMSGTFNAMDLAVEELLKKYPERKFYTIDTNAITLCSYNIVCEVGDMYKAGKTAEEMVAWANDNVNKFAAYFFANDLKFFCKSGRVNGLKALMGNLIGIRPILNMSADGMMSNVDQATGRVKTLKRILQYVEDLQEDIYNHRVVIGHTDDVATAKQLQQMLAERFGEKLNTEIVVVNPTAGSHCGPNGAGICFYAKHR